MIIYDQEKDDGIDITLLTKGCISYASHVEPCDQDSLINNIKLDKTVAGINDKDLYYVQSILVTSNWNKNDDIFDKAEIWKARSTPEDKPTNLEHDESIIIGHITSNQAITDDGQVIDPEIDLSELPDKYHILTGSVIYLGFTKDELKERASKLVSEIEAGTKYVSMECFFNNFDYGLINKETNEYKILSRDHDSAYLTKYLRAYGGKGEYENYKIGRVLRNITFSGKGFVDKPANENSIIFSKSMLDDFATEKKTLSTEKGVVDNNLILTKPETQIMSEETSLASLEEKLDSFVADQAKACDLQAQLDELTSKLEAEQQEKELAMKNNEEMNKEKEDKMAEMNAMVEQLKGELEEARVELAKYKEMAEEHEAEKKRMARVEALKDAGVQDVEEAEAMMALSDEQFEGITAFLRKMVKAEEVVAEEVSEEEATEAEEVASEEETEKDETKAEESVADAEILEQVEFEDDVSLAVSEEDSAESELENTRAALIDFVKSRLQITK